MPSRRFCLFCGTPENVTRHHLHPKAVNVKRLKADHKNRTIPLCRECHDQLHAMYNTKKLAAELYSSELLLADPNIKRWIQFRRKGINRGKRLDAREMKERIRARLVI